MRTFFKIFGSLLLLLAALYGQTPTELRFCIRSDPRTFDPVLVDGESEESIRYLTGGVLMRVNRSTQKLEPELAKSWRVSEGGRRITFHLRETVRFSDGTPFTSDDVAFTMKRLLDPNVHSPTGDSFRSGSGEVKSIVDGPLQVTLLFPAPVATLERLFDQVAIQSARSSRKEMAVLGPYQLAEHKQGSHVLLRRNPNYWKKDASGRQLPYLDTIRMDVQANRDIELLRFQRGEIHLITGLDAEAYDRLRAGGNGSAVDAGASYDSEMLWFNQVQNAPLPPFKKAWFRSQVFRRAISAAIQREDIVRLVYRNHAQPAAGPYSTANALWFNNKLKPPPYAPEDALKNLQKDGFRLNGGKLQDRSGNVVEFSLITNSGNKARAKIASLIQQDLAKIGVQLNVVPLDMKSLIERINKSFDYEACLLGLVNVDPDPSGQMNVWLSSAANHQWNPGQKAPETAWEAEIDQLMRAQASTADQGKRRASFNRVQEIISEQAPFVYLVTKNSLVAVTPKLQGVTPAALRPQLFWNAERLSFRSRAKMTPAVLSTRLSVDYPGNVGVLKDVQLDVRAGEIVGLVGQSGSGKSTLALAVLRLLPGRSARVYGTAEFMGHNLLECTEKELRTIRGRQIGLVLQNPSASLNPHLRLRTQLKEAWKAHSNADWSNAEERVLELLQKLDLQVDKSFLRRYPSEISVGQAQRVLLAMATIHHPPLLIADEPTSALDPIARVELLELFRRLNRELGTALLYISHDLSTVASLCHRVCILREGQIIETGTPDEIFYDPKHPYTQALVKASTLPVPVWAYQHVPAP